LHAQHWRRRPGPTSRGPVTPTFTTLSVPNTSGDFWNILSVDENLTVSNTALGSGRTVILKIGDGATFTLGDDTTCNLPSMQTIDTHTGSFVKVGTGTVQVMSGDGTLNPDWWRGTIDVQEGTFRAGGDTMLGNTSMLTVRDGAMFVCGQDSDDVMGLAVTLNGSGIADAGALHFTPSGKLYTTAPFTLATDSVINVSNATGEFTLLGNMDGSGRLTKIGPGALLLNGDCQHAGDAVVNAGTIGGTGSLVGKLVHNPGTRLEPGASPGTFTVGSAELAGGVFEIEINDANGQPGSNWDYVDAGSALEITATGGDPVTVELHTVSAEGLPAPLPVFDNTANYSWAIARADAITGLTVDNVVVDATMFQNALGIKKLSVRVMGDELKLVFGSALDGDVNGDCKVNILDLIFIRNRLNQDPGTADNWKADVNGDDKINILDLIYVRNRLNTKCPE
jgi:hypothetical protein